MVAIPTGRVARYIQKPDANLTGFLLHGTDAGLIREHGAELRRQLAAALPDDPEVVRLSDDDLASDPDRLAVEAQTLSMFSPSKIIRLRISGRAVQELAKFAWDHVPENVRIIVEAGNLRKDAKLRKLFESAKALAALPCHDGNDPANLSELIRREVSQAGLTIRGDAERHLAGLLETDLGVAKAEVAKLITYASNAGEITVDDVDAVIGDASQGTLDAAVDAIVGGEPALATRQMEKLRASGTPPDVVLVALSQHLLRLLRLRAKMDAGSPAGPALKSFRPPLHFRRAEQMERQIRQWDRARLKFALDLASSRLGRARLNPATAHQLVADLIFRLSRSHGSRQKTP